MGNGNWYAGNIQTIHHTKIQWKWLDDNTLTTRTLGKLQHQSPEPITDIELQYLHGDSTLHRDEVRSKITSNTPPLPHTPQSADMCTEHQIGSLEGFWDTLNHKKWTSTLRWMEFEFDPTSFLTRRPNTSPPFGTARRQFIETLRASSNLLAQFCDEDGDGNIMATQKYDQMQMLVRCLPILLLRISSPAQRRKFTPCVNHRCALFLKGEWQTLYEEALSDMAMQNEWEQTHIIKRRDNNTQQLVLDQVRKQNYSKAMNILQSPGLAVDSPAVILQKLQDLHPADSADHVEIHSGLVIPASTFKFIDGPWVRRQIQRNKRGTAVDQWGWDSKEMWRDIINDNELLNLVARHWIRPIAAGYLPHKYRQHLAGGRLVALSKAPKPGVRPINITDTWRRIAAKGLLRECMPSYRKYFQEDHPRVFQFAAATPNGATVMYQIVRSIIASQSDGNSEESDPVQIFCADVRNAFNEESRQHIRSFYAKGCPVPVDPNNPASHKTWDILWKYIQAHYNVNPVFRPEPI